MVLEARQPVKRSEAEAQIPFLSTYILVTQPGRTDLESLADSLCLLLFVGLFGFQCEHSVCVEHVVLILLVTCTRSIWTPATPNGVNVNESMDVMRFRRTGDAAVLSQVAFFPRWNEYLMRDPGLF